MNGEFPTSRTLTYLRYEIVKYRPINGEESINTVITLWACTETSNKPTPTQRLLFRLPTTSPHFEPVGVIDAIGVRVGLAPEPVPTPIPPAVVFVSPPASCEEGEAPCEMGEAPCETGEAPCEMGEVPFDIVRLALLLW